MISPAMEHHHHTRHHHLEVSSGSVSPNGNDELEHEASQVAQQQNTASANMNGLKEKCSLSDIWRMSSPAEIASKLVLMTQAPRICAEMRSDGVLPLLVQLLHQHSTEDGMLSIGADCDSTLEIGHRSHQATSEMFRTTLALRRNSAKALRNIVHNTSKNKKEVKILSLLEDLRSFVEILYLKCSEMPVDAVDHPCTQLADIFTIVCDQECKKIIELLGGVYVIADVIQSDFCFHRDSNTNDQCYQLRQHALNILTYMTANNAHVKSLLGSMRPFIFVLVETLQQAPQLDNPHLIQAVANVLHNLSWKTDYLSKQIMRDAQAVTHLAKAAMTTKDVITLKALLEPLLNLTAHCSPNKVDFCKVDGVLDFLISTLSFSNGSTSSAPTRHQLAIIENSGGILRNICSYLVNQDDLMEELRLRNVVAILLEQLKSPSLAIVSNACITLSHLSSRSVDQRKMKELGALQMLHSLTSSKHETIKFGASKTLHNLLTAHVPNYTPSFNESPGMSTSYSIPSSLQLRKMKALKTELNNCLTENYDAILGDSPNGSPKHTQTLNRSANCKSYSINMVCSSYSGTNGLPSSSSANFHKVTRSSSHDSIGSTHSEPGSKMLRSAQSDQKAAVAAYKNLANNSSPLDQRMINSYSGQTMNSIYATLPANSRICDNKLSMDSANDTADYDISCCDISGINNSISGGANGSSSFLGVAELEDDPEPTDYSQRFKEQPMDDFAAPRSGSKNENACEDTVKVYQTENTPLAFSLAPSLSDLREIDAKLNYSGRSDDCKSKMNDDLADRFNVLELSKTMHEEKLFKKPILPPKPLAKYLHTSASAYNLKNLGAINEESSLDENIDVKVYNSKNVLAKSLSNHESITSYCSQPESQNKKELSSPIQYKSSNSVNSMVYENYMQGGNANWATKSHGHWPAAPPPPSPPANAMSTPLRNVIAASVNQKADTMEHLVPTDLSTIFATEDTPARFSRTTSLSSLTMDDLDASEGDFAAASHNEDAQMENQAFNTESSRAPMTTTSPINHYSTESEEANNRTCERQGLLHQSTSPPPQPRQQISHMVSKAALVKATPVAAKRMSKSQPLGPIQLPTRQYGKQITSSSPPPRRPPRKPLPAEPRNQSPPCIFATMHSISPHSADQQQNDDDDYDFFISKCRQAALPKDSAPSKPQRFSPKSNTSSSARKSPNMKSFKIGQPSPVMPNRFNQSASSRVLQKTDVKAEGTNVKAQSSSKQVVNTKPLTPVFTETTDAAADEEEDQFLEKCRQIAINKQSTIKPSKKGSSSNREGKSPRIYKNLAQATSIESTNHFLTHVLKVSDQSAHMMDQEKQYFVEDTPVQFSQCHSPLSSLFDSGDEIENHQPQKTSEVFDNRRKQKVVIDAAAAAYPEMSENESESASTATATLTIPSNTHARQSGKSIAAGQQQITPVCCAAANLPNSTVPVSTGNQNFGVTGGNAISLQATSDNAADRQLSMEDVEDDERTYTICTQSSRLSSATLTASASQSGHLKSMNTSTLVMSDHSSVGGSILDLEMVNPPSLLDDHNLMFSSLDMNMAQIEPRSVPNSRAASARVKRSEASHQLGHNLHQGFKAHSFEDSLAHSLLENQKPPSIMEHSSFMSQSTASITSEISDIAFDKVPIRKSSPDLVAEVASNCAKELFNLADRCMNGAYSDGIVSSSSTASQSASMSSSTSKSKRMAVTKSTDDLLIEQRADRTFDMEPTPTPRTLPRSNDRNSSGTTGTTTVTIARTSTNTRTYNKTDRTKNTNTTEKTLDAEQKVDDDLADSDTDISEVLPLDDVRSVTREFVSSRVSRQSPTKRSTAPTMPQYSNPMDSPQIEKKPLPAPQYKPRPQVAPANFELTDEESTDDDRLPIGYSHSLNTRRSSRKNFARDDTASVQLESSSMRFGSFGTDVHGAFDQTHPLSNHHNLAFHSLGRRGYGSGKVKSEKDFEDKELLFTAQHKNAVLANHAQFFQSKANNNQSIKTASKYFDRHAAALSSMTHEDLQQTQHIDRVSYTDNNGSYVPLPTSTSKRSSNIDPSITKSSSKGSSKEKGTSFLSKLSSSFSSHNLGSHSTNSGNSSLSGAVTPSSSKNSFNKINSKIASLWKRSKSTHDKLDQEALTANPGKNMKAAELNRNLTTRRSMGKQKIFDTNQNQQQNISHSLTYEKLPANEEEAVKMGGHLESNNNDCHCSAESSCGDDQFDSQPAKVRYTGHTADSINGNFTFTTFVKTHSSNLGSSFESVSTQSSVDRNAAPKKRNNVPLANAMAPVEDSSGISSAASSASTQQPRKTCLVTTV